MLLCGKLAQENNATEGVDVNQHLKTGNGIAHANTATNITTDPNANVNTNTIANTNAIINATIANANTTDKCKNRY